MTLEIQVIAWDRHKNVSELKQQLYIRLKICFTPPTANFVLSHVYFTQCMQCPQQKKHD